MPKPMGRSRALQHLSTPEDKDKSPLVTPPCALPQKEGGGVRSTQPVRRILLLSAQAVFGEGGGGGRQAWGRRIRT